MNRALQLLVNRQGLCDKSIRHHLRLTSQQLAQTLSPLTEHDQHDHDITKLLLESGDVALCEQLIDVARSGCYDNCLFFSEYIIAKRGDLKMLQFLVTKGQKVFTTTTLRGALQGKHFDIVIWLLKNGNYTYMEVSDSCSGSPLESLQWLVMIGVRPQIGHIYSTIVHWKNFSKLQFLLQLFEGDVSYGRLWRNAIFADTKERTTKRVKYVRETCGIDFDVNVVRWALERNAMYNHHENYYGIVEYFLSNRCHVSRPLYAQLPEHLQQVVDGWFLLG